MIPKINQPFKVSFERFKDTFDCKIIAINSANDDFQKYTIEVSNKKTRVEYSSGTIAEQNYPNNICLVDTDWFNTELTGRIIKI